MAIFLIIGAFLILFIFVISQQSTKRDNVSVCKNRMEEEFKKQNFNKEKSIEYKIPLHETDIFIDKTNKKIAFCEYSKNNISFLNFNSILDCEIVEDDIVTKNGLGRAVVGSVVAGGVGAVVGAITANEKKIVKSLGIKLITNDTLNALKIIELLNIQVNKNSNIYKQAIDFATEVHSTILSIIKTTA